MGLLKGLSTTGKLVLGLFAIVECVGVVVFGASVIAYHNEPQTFYIITGTIGVLVAVLAEVA
ncbi:MAG: hypothetical protein WCK56_07075 [Alcaligenaceae bacterium]